MTTNIDSKVMAINETVGNLGYTSCDICKNRGYIAYIDGDYIRTRECECMKKRRSVRIIKQSGIEEMINTYTFSKFDEKEKSAEVIKKKAIEFLKVGKGRWFVVTGKPGTGKTHICTALARELMLKGIETRCILWREKAPRLKAMINDREEYEKELEDLKTVDVLMIDDFWKGTVTDADINLAFEIINGRYNSKKLTTIISSEKSIEDILSIDEAIGSRIYEKSNGFCFNAKGVNRRLKNG